MTNIGLINCIYIVNTEIIILSKYKVYLLKTMIIVCIFNT